MPRKEDLRRVDRVAKELGIDRDAFGEYLHACKESGDKGSAPRGDYTPDELWEKGMEFKEHSRQGMAGRNRTSEAASARRSCRAQRSATGAGRALVPFFPSLLHGRDEGSSRQGTNLRPSKNQRSGEGIARTGIARLEMEVDKLREMRRRETRPCLSRSLARGLLSYRRRWPPRPMATRSICFSTTIPSCPSSQTPILNSVRASRNQRGKTTSLIGNCPCRRDTCASARAGRGLGNPR